MFAERNVSAQIMEENIKPVLVFNKADLGCDRQKIDEAIKHIARQFPCIYHKYSSTSNDSPVAGIHNKKAKRSCLVGSSGVGKSSLGIPFAGNRY